MTEEDVLLLGEPLPDGSGGIELVSTLGGEHVADALGSVGVDDLWRDAQRRMGQVDAIFLSPWYGFTALDIGRDLMRHLQAAGGGQLIFSDPPGGDDQRLRWVDRWQRSEACEDVEVVVMAEPRRGR